MEDGYRLPVQQWIPDAGPRAIILALHGFNDYRNAFAGTAEALRDEGIHTVAYDQRGFGETVERGHWAGSDRLISDMHVMAELLCERYPHKPLWLLGESMGAAVILASLQATSLPGCIEGVVLLAPAVWGWESMPLWQQAALWLGAHIAPGQTVTGEGLDIMASDNIEMLQALGRDPLVIKETRIDAIFGLTNLMEEAMLSGSGLDYPALVLYGEKDEIIPPHAVCRMLAIIPGEASSRLRTVLYAEGYHMLTRDLQGDAVIGDIAAWINDKQAKLPSGAVDSRATFRERLACYP